MTEKMSLNIDDLTVGEVEVIEELTGQSINALGAENTPKGKLLRALVFVLKKRDDPDYTWEQAGDVKLQLVDVERPTDAAGSSS